MELDLASAKEPLRRITDEETGKPMAKASTQHSLSELAKPHSIRVFGCAAGLGCVLPVRIEKKTPT
jgi:hypothetical protein